MTFESKNEMTCPVTGQVIELTELYDAEIGGSCQADVSCISTYCSAEDGCPHKRSSHDCPVNSGACSAPR